MTVVLLASGVPATPPTWRVVAIPGASEANLAGGPDRAYALSPQGLSQSLKIFRSLDDGATWPVVYPSGAQYGGAEGDLRSFGNDVISFGMGVTAGISSLSEDGGTTWITSTFASASPGDQAWLYLGATPGPESLFPKKPYTLAGWFRNGGVAVFSGDGGTTWPVSTPLAATSATGPVLGACEGNAHPPMSLGDIRIADPDYARSKAGLYGAWGPDARFYWSYHKPDENALYVCGTQNLGSVWNGVRHPVPDFDDEVVVLSAIDDRGTLFVLIRDRLFVSFDRGSSFAFTHVLDVWGNHNAGVGNAPLQWFVADGGAIHLFAARTAPGCVPGDECMEFVYRKGAGADTAAISWSPVEVIATAGNANFHFVQISLDSNGLPSVSYVKGGDVQVASRSTVP